MCNTCKDVFFLLFSHTREGVDRVNKYDTTIPRKKKTTNIQAPPPPDKIWEAHWEIEWKNAKPPKYPEAPHQICLHRFCAGKAKLDERLETPAQY